MSPCKFDGRICTTSKAVLSNPGEFVHNTGRTYCTERVTVPSCDARMRARGFGQLLDELRPKPYELYPQVDGHTTSTFVSGVNFNGELGLGLRRAVHEPTIQTYFKIGDGLFAQEMGSGRGFKNVSIINFGFSHGFALDTQGVLYAWGSNSFGQLGIRNRANRDGHRFHQVRTQFTRFTSTKLQLLTHLDCVPAALALPAPLLQADARARLRGRPLGPPPLQGSHRQEHLLPGQRIVLQAWTGSGRASAQRLRRLQAAFAGLYTNSKPLPLVTKAR